MVVRRTSYSLYTMERFSTVTSRRIGQDDKLYPQCEHTLGDLARIVVLSRFFERYEKWGGVTVTPVLCQQ